MNTYIYHRSIFETGAFMPTFAYKLAKLEANLISICVHVSSQLSSIQSASSASLLSTTTSGL
jgi:hypothetical protein